MPYIVFTQVIKYLNLTFGVLLQKLTISHLVKHLTF